MVRMRLFDNPQSLILMLSFESGRGGHHIPTISNEAFSRAAFDRITSGGYETLKKRFVLASEAIQGYDLSAQEFAMLDDAITSGNRYNELIKAYLGLGPPVAADASGGMFKAVSATLAWAVGNYDDSDAVIAHNMRKMGRLADISVLDMITRSEWSLRLPTTAAALATVATQWIIERLEAQSNAYAHRNSDEQFRSAEPTYRGRVENTFRNMFISRLKKMKEEVNKAEVENYPGYASRFIAQPDRICSSIFG